MKEPLDMEVPQDPPGMRSWLLNWTPWVSPQYAVYSVCMRSNLLCKANELLVLFVIMQWYSMHQYQLTKYIAFIIARSSLSLNHFISKHFSSLLFETKEKSSKDKPAIQLWLTFTSRRAGSPDTFCFILHCAGNGSVAYHGEAGVTSIGDRRAIWVGIFISSIVLPIDDGWRGITLGNWDE